jgi:glycosyltransferase involved in cell wall biosynthesis
MSMKLAMIDECYQTSGFGGISLWTNRLTSYFSSIKLDYEIFSYQNGLKIRIPKSLKFFPNVREMIFYPYLGRRYLPEIEREYNIIHFTAAASLAGYQPRVPTVVSVHYLQTLQNAKYKKILPVKYKLIFNPIVDFWLRQLEQLAFPRADRITVCKEEFKQYLVKNYQVDPGKVVIIKYGLDPSQFIPEWDWSKKERSVIFIGRGSIGKGFDTLVEAAPKINGNIVAVASRIPKYLQEKISQLNNFQVFKGIPNKELIDLYKKASIFVMPSLSEGSPLSTLEAMACGLPVVCTVEGGGGYIEHSVNGTIFPFRDSIALANQVNDLLDNPQLAKQFGQVNREKVEKHYTIPIIAEQTVNVYRELLNEKGSNGS